MSGDDLDQNATVEDEVIRLPSAGRILPWLATLSAARLAYRVRRGTDSWEILVPAAEATAARHELAEYERVNANWPPVYGEPAAVPPIPGTGTVAYLVAVAGLLWFFCFTGPYDPHVRLFKQGCADSAQIIAGEWWRAVTALTLHADTRHVLGNAICCLFFGLTLCRDVGLGVSWCLVLLAGVLGNLATAYLTGPGRVALGASTATFGALGLMSVFQFVRNYRQYHELRSVWNRTWIPLGAGTALLALLGAGPGADVLGHLCGFVAGLLSACATTRLLENRTPDRVQALLAITAALVVFGAWHLALSP